MRKKISMFEKKFRDCRAKVKNNIFTVENSRIRRVMQCRKGIFFTSSLYDKKNEKEWVKTSGKEHDFYYSGLTCRADGLPAELTVCGAEVKIIENVFQHESLSLLVSLYDPVRKMLIKRVYTIFPECAAIHTGTVIHTPAVPLFFQLIECSHAIVKKTLHNVIDSIGLDKNSKQVKAVSFFGRTDQTNDMVKVQAFKTAAGKNLFLQGNMIFLTDGSRNGLFMTQEAPSCGEKRQEGECDFMVSGGAVKSLGWGILPYEFKDCEMKTYGNVIGIFHGADENGEAEFKKYFCMRFKDSEENFKSMANPWGGGGAIWRKNISEKFIIKEINACREMSLDMYQVDDGWQENRSLEELTGNNRILDNASWSVRKDLFPRGFTKLAGHCRRLKVELCLWFAPSMNRLYRDWQDQADLLFSFYKKYGIKTFKIDGVINPCREAEENLGKLLGTLRERSGGKIYFNLDTTSGMRPGYLFFQEYGNVFLENRYQQVKGLRRFEPWKTLRNLWRLARYIPAQRLQVEFMDVEAARRLKENYSGSSYPEKYSQEYVCSQVLFASPLCWAYPSFFTAGGRLAVKKIMMLRKKICSELYRSVIIPIGQEPSGKSWTGFQAHNFNTGSGFCIFYRETAKSKTADFTLFHLEKTIYNFESLTENSCGFCADFFRQKNINIEINDMNSFRLYRYTQKK